MLMSQYTSIVRTRFHLSPTNLSSISMLREAKLKIETGLFYFSRGSHLVKKGRNLHFAFAAIVIAAGLAIVA